jgi:KUP system potassium uptake protein
VRYPLLIDFIKPNAIVNHRKVSNDTLDTGTKPLSIKKPKPSAEKTALTLAALGVVFGDIGTSPLYALRECFSGPNGLPVTPENAIGAVSLILWFLIIIVSVKYGAFVMRADNNGEGGVLSLVALVRRIGPGKIRNASVLPLLGVLGAAFLFSDGVITPAVSVLSAIEGVTVAAPVLGRLVIPISLLVLTALFIIQIHGTSRIGMLFGPIVLLWFIAIGVLGLVATINCPGILKAFNPFFAVLLLKSLGGKCLFLLGAAFLAVTGAEVLYADMGHFGKSPIRFAWLYVVFPALILNYLGQGAKLLNDRAVPQNLFYSLSPSWFLVPLIVIATLATVIASQAVISGAFSLARQSVQLGFWPRIQIVHTSRSNINQVYLPFINLTLYVVTFLLVVGFKESGNLASAYGIAVSGTMLLTTFLVTLLAWSFWKIPTYILVPASVFFLMFDGTLFVANVSKFMTGGWIVVVMAVSVSILMTTWMSGRRILQKSVLSESVGINDFAKSLASQEIIRTPRTAVFLSGNPASVPRSLLHNFKHNGSMHSVNVIVSVQTEEIPYVDPLQRISVIDFGSGIFSAVLRYGYMESPNVPREITGLPAATPALNDPAQISYFLGKETLVITKNRRMPLWRKRIFLVMSRNALSASAFYNLPPNRVVELGVQIEF